ncbi:MAG: DUF479 domain-containing protein [Bacteroidia bacterium]|nr:MAG: DUF479 domain-containing protein [Bacteroidia bacterium]
MNFLAHLYLSGNKDHLIIGNFIADMVKGSQINGYSSSVKEGILLHRQIDTFTDAHVVVSRSKERLRERYRLYAGVVVDMYYDHFLARYWDEFSAHALDEYVARAYRILDGVKTSLPPRAQYILPFMVDHNWLVNYADPDSLRRNFAGMARRTPFDSGMETAVEYLLRHYKDFEEEFRLFFPDIVNFVEELGVSHEHHQNGQR